MLNNTTISYLQWISQILPAREPHFFILVGKMSTEYSKLCLSSAETGEAKDYKKATAALKPYFQPQKSVEYEKCTFCKATQQVGNTLDTYYTRLQQLATYCEFQDKDADVKSQIVSGCSSKRVRRQAL